eukprot:sb/3464085/
MTGQFFVVLSLLCSLSWGEVNIAEINYLIEFYNALDGDNWSVQESWGLSGVASVTNLTTAETLRNGMANGEGLTWSDGYRLKELSLTNMALTGDVPDGIDALSELEKLVIPENSITSFPSLENVTLLTKVDFSYNSINALTGNFPTSLQTLYLTNNSLSEDISTFFGRIQNQSGLVDLNLNGNEFSGNITTVDLSDLNFNALTTLQMSNNMIEGSLVSIKSSWTGGLDLSDNYISGSYPDNLIGVSDADLKCNMFLCDSLANDASDYNNISECFCSNAGEYVTLNNSEISCVTCDSGKMANKWVRFSFWLEDGADYSYDCSYATDGCVNCMFPENCKDGSCEEGSEGPTCEKCSDGYRMAGGKCRECLDSKVPIAALALLIIVTVIIGYGIFLTGLNPLAATMIKQLMSYLQMFYLTLGIRAAWGTYLSELSDVYKLSMMNTQSFDLECLTDLSPLTLFYIHWATASIWPIITTIVVLAVDKGLVRWGNWEISWENSG